MGQRRVDGIFVSTETLSQDDANQLLRYRVPIVAVENSPLDGFDFTVYHDHHAGSAELTRHLLEQGHRHIGYLGSPRSGRANQERMDGVRTALREQGLELRAENAFQAEEGSSQGGEDCGHQLIKMAKPPTAMICFNDAMAIGLVHVLRLAGWCIPADCSIVGYDNISYSAYTVPALTTFDQPKYELGALAAEMMLKLVNRERDQDTPVKSHKLLGSLVIRNSTAGPRTGLGYRP